MTGHAIPAGAAQGPNVLAVIMVSLGVLVVYVFWEWSRAWYRKRSEQASYGAAGLARVHYSLRCRWWRYRKPAELRGDWWSQFERDLRRYASQASSSGRAGNDQPGRRKPLP